MALHYNANTFWIIHRMWKAFMVVSQAVNENFGSARELQDSIKLKTYEILKFRSRNFDENFFIKIFLCSLWQRKHILRHTEAVKSLWILILSGERYLEGITKHSKFFEVVKMSHVIKIVDDPKRVCIVMQSHKKNYWKKKSSSKFLIQIWHFLEVFEEVSDHHDAFYVSITD